METLSLIIAIAALCLVVVVLMFLKAEKANAREAREALDRNAQHASEKLADLTSRLAQMNETQAAAQTHISKALENSLNHHTEKTGKAMGDLHERLAVIDAAQKNLTDLSEQVVGLQDILSNKQARGAFGEVQLNDLVKSILPPSAYQFQATLSTGSRADCLLSLPNPPGSIVVDAKFPLESYRALQDAKDDAARVQASRTFSADIKKHIHAIADKYIVPGETAESALMFLPSEAVYAELHANFLNVVEDSYRQKVWIVSPTTLMATLNTIRAVLKDASMREQAGLIQGEVLKMLEDVGRMDDRVGKLEKHFGNVLDDIKGIKTSSGKINKRGVRIQDIELGEDDDEELSEPPHLVPLPGGKE